MKKTLSVLLFAFVLIAFMSVCNFFSSQAQTTIYVQKLSTPTPTPTPGGEVAYTYLTGLGDKGASLPVTTSSFTPASGTRLLVVAGLQDVDGSGAIVGSAATISSSPSLTWTPIGNVSDDAGGGNYRYGIAAWISSPVTNVSHTVAVSVSGTSLVDASIVVAEISGASGTTNGVVSATGVVTTGSYSTNLTATPTTNDLAVFVRLEPFDGATGNGGIAMESGWANLYDAVYGSETQIFSVSAHSNLSSTGINVTNICVEDWDVTWEDETLVMGFIVRAS